LVQSADGHPRAQSNQRKSCGAVKRSSVRYSTSFLKLLLYSDRVANVFIVHHRSSSATCAAPKL